MRTPYLAPTREAGRRWDIGGQGSTRSGRREKIRPGAGTSGTYVDETFPVGSVGQDYAIPSKSCDDSIRGETYAEKGRDQHEANVEDDDHCSVGLRDNVGLYVGLAVIGRSRWPCGGDRIVDADAVSCRHARQAMDIGPRTKIDKIQERGDLARAGTSEPTMMRRSC